MEFRATSGLGSELGHGIYGVQNLHYVRDCSLTICRHPKGATVLLRGAIRPRSLGRSRRLGPLAIEPVKVAVSGAISPTWPHPCDPEEAAATKFSPDAAMGLAAVKLHSHEICCDEIVDPRTLPGYVDILKTMEATAKPSISLIRSNPSSAIYTHKSLRFLVLHPSVSKPPKAFFLLRTFLTHQRLVNLRGQR